jgi:hypothetical protein
MRYERDSDLRNGDTFAWVRIEMHDPDEHGMGSAEEATYVYPVEDRVVEAASGRLVYVGRLRNDNVWQLIPSGAATTSFSSPIRAASVDARPPRRRDARTTRR